MENIKVRIECGYCVGEVELLHSMDAEQYQISNCPFCASDDIDMEELDVDE